MSRVGIFEYAVAYVEDLSAFPADLARGLAGVKGVAVKLHDAEGNPHADDNLAELRAGERRRLHEQGFSVGLWSCPRFAPELAAADCSRLYAELGLSFAVFETEWHYKTDGGGVDVARLLGPWRERRPRAFTGLAVEGNPETFNHAAAIRADCRLLCETYWLAPAGDPAYDARACFERARSFGWDLARVHPTLIGVDRHDMGEAIVRAYRARTAGFVRGVMLWRGDMLTARDYRLVGLADDLARR
jgi:hypothetical protein